MDQNYQNRKKLISLIEGLKLSELIELNKLAVERIRLMQKATALVAMSQFAVGDRVSWISSDGTKYIGQIIRINHKTASVKVSEHGYWNVSPQLLQKEF
jgi:hypothetical protein